MIARSGRREHTYIRHAKTRRTDLHVLFCQYANPPLSSPVKEKSGQTGLHQAVRLLAQVALLDLAVHVIPIRIKARGEIFLDRNECGARHRRTLLYYAPFKPVERDLAIRRMSSIIVPATA